MVYKTAMQIPQKEVEALKKDVYRNLNLWIKKEKSKYKKIGWFNDGFIQRIIPKVYINK